VLSSRPYRSTSLLLDILTEDYGRIGAVAKSARGPKSRYRGMLQVFTPLHIDWTGNGELKNLGNIELKSITPRFQTTPLFCAYYLNELLVRLLQREDACPIIFKAYQSALNAMARNVPVECVLREFELTLITALGYGISFEYEAETGRPIEPDNYYLLSPELGFLIAKEASSTEVATYLGETLLAIHAKNWQMDSALSSAKQILKVLLSSHLGDKPLQSRRLLMDLL
jgi:DNA repair protein RecO (recombination protein O)